MSTANSIPETALHHDPGADPADAVGACVPRVVLRCSDCLRFPVYCHLNADVLRAYKAGPWLCQDCRGEGV